jgi:hypothetical protein
LAAATQLDGAAADGSAADGSVQRVDASAAGSAASSSALDASSVARWSIQRGDIVVVRLDGLDAHRPVLPTPEGHYAGRPSREEEARRQREQTQRRRAEQRTTPPPPELERWREDALALGLAASTGEEAGGAVTGGDGNSNPALDAADADADLLVSKFPAALRFGAPAEVVVKRVVGLPGDVLQLPPLVSAAGPFHPASPFGQHASAPRTVRVPPGHVWIEGDNPFNSNDSRYYGPVPVDRIEGRAVARFWPPWEYKSLDRASAPRPTVNSQWLDAMRSDEALRERARADVLRECALQRLEREQQQRRDWDALQPEETGAHSRLTAADDSATPGDSLSAIAVGTDAEDADAPVYAVPMPEPHMCAPPIQAALDTTAVREMQLA